MTWAEIVAQLLTAAVMMAGIFIFAVIWAGLYLYNNLGRKNGD